MTHPRPQRRGLTLLVLLTITSLFCFAHSPNAYWGAAFGLSSAAAAAETVHQGKRIALSTLWLLSRAMPGRSRTFWYATWRADAEDGEIALNGPLDFALDVALGLPKLAWVEWSGSIMRLECTNNHPIITEQRLGRSAAWRLVTLSALLLSGAFGWATLVCQWGILASRSFAELVMTLCTIGAVSNFEYATGSRYSPSHLVRGYISYAAVWSICLTSAGPEGFSVAAGTAWGLAGATLAWQFAPKRARATSVIIVTPALAILGALPWESVFANVISSWDAILFGAYAWGLAYLDRTYNGRGVSSAGRVWSLILVLSTAFGYSVFYSGSVFALAGSAVVGIVAGTTFGSRAKHAKCPAYARA